MKELERLKLNALSKTTLKEREMERIYGGNYCATYGDNQRANEDQGVCSCNCLGGDYYSCRGDEAATYKTL